MQLSPDVIVSGMYSPDAGHHLGLYCHSATYGMPYNSTMFLARLTSLTERREQLARKFFE